MKIEDLAKEAAKHIRTEHGLQLSDFIATEFARRLFALRDAEAVPVGLVKWNTGGLVVHIVGDVKEGDSLYLHAPAPSDLVEENERLKAEYQMRCKAVDLLTEQNNDLRQQLAESQAREKKRIYWLLSNAMHSDNCDVLFLDEEDKHMACSCGLEAALSDSDDTALREYVEKEIAPLREAIDRHVENGKVFERVAAELAALKQQEPVAYRHRDGMLSCRLPGGGVAGIDWTPLYAAPATDYKPIAERLLGALEYHQQQTRPIQTTIEAIAAAKAAGLGEE